MTRALYNDETPPWKRVTRRLDEIEAADRAASAIHHQHRSGKTERINQMSGVWRTEQIPTYEELLAIRRGEMTIEDVEASRMGDEPLRWRMLSLDEIETLNRAVRRRKVEAAIALGMACFAVLFSLFALVMSIRVLP